ncbi:CGNR zinc finger domain-containing protein [Streptomyces sp. KL118A]|uniref:CGNR zinc finger domain-containing protein n=1 Tax=Streptomyces sp. KL118A TaxID=3045153 RepID=UPI00278C851C|nr:CGNR zinc finger domain-containing protein [Streptomyces sp. KL118A]
MKSSFSDYTLGAGVATDLVNTSALVRRSTGEVLVDAAALGHFLAEHHLAPDALSSGRAPTDRDLEQVLALRQEVRSLLESQDEDGLADRANALVERAGTRPVLERDADGHWQWFMAAGPGATLADDLAALIGTGLLGVLHTLSGERVRPCASPVCDGMFVDTSKAGRRRYCTPGLCGNRLNVARHRARQLPEEAG